VYNSVEEEGALKNITYGAQVIVTHTPDTYSSGLNGGFGRELILVV